jgi:hypothetical protein
MARIRFLYSNLFSAASAVASASASVSALPPANAQVPDRTLVWRSTTTTGDQWIKVDLGSAQAVTAIAVANPKLHGSGGTLKIQSSPDDAIWTDRGSIPSADADSKVAFLFIGSVSARYWRFYFTNVGVASDYVELGYAFLGTYLEPSINVTAQGLSTPLLDRSVVVESITGQATTTVRPKQAKGAFGFDSMSESDTASLVTMFRAQGFGTPFFVVLDTSLAWTAWLIAFRSPLARGWQANPGQYDPSFEWEEAL